MKTIIMKFGGAAVATPAQFSSIADLIIARMDEYQRVVIVVSAMGDTTDQLIALAKAVNPHPPQREYDMLVTVGERISISLLAMALAAKNQNALSFTGSQSGIITCDRHTNARIIDVKPSRLTSCLDAGNICIVAGFQGVSRIKNDITTLGRGGSDTTAVALGIALRAEKVEFFKDVPGIFNEDPKRNPQATLLPRLSYDEALNIISRGAEILHGRCIQLARSNSVLLHVLPFDPTNESQGTVIFDGKSAEFHNPIYEDVF